MRSAIIAAATVMFFTNADPRRQSKHPADGPSAGKAIFEGAGQCLTCHSINNLGGTLGPDLSWIGMLRTPESLMTSLIDPDTRVSRRYFTIVVETKAGDQIEGVVLNEDDLSIQIRDARGDPRSFIKSDLKDLRREARSLMPSYRSTLSSTDISHLISYLRTLRTLGPLENGERPREIPPATENAAFFDRPARDDEERPDLLLRALEIPAGATVADIGSGTGYFTWRLAEHVGPRGKVYAVDVQQKMLEITRATVDRHKIDNVEYLLSRDNDLRLPERSIDFAFIAYAYHEFADPSATMLAIRRALTPGGCIFILEYAQEAGVSPASPLHSMRFDDIRREIEPMGFVVDRLLDFLPVQHGVIFTVR
ncbi:MAG: class I SAM-dependent methyltransferase [Vicinamibacterales bacterium]